MAHIVEAGAAPADDPYHHVDYAAGDLLGENDTAISAALDVFQQPGAMDKRIKLPFGELKGAHLLNILIDDEFLHGWDLAKATGQAMNDGRRADGRPTAGGGAPTPVDRPVPWP